VCTNCTDVSICDENCWHLEFWGWIKVYGVLDTGRIVMVHLGMALPACGLPHFFLT
jgi:hypothetical protein